MIILVQTSSSDVTICPHYNEAVALPFYYPNIDRVYAASLIQSTPHGTFLLRDSSDREARFAVSFSYYGHVLHARIEYQRETYRFLCVNKQFRSRNLKHFLKSFDEDTLYVFSFQNYIKLQLCIFIELKDYVHTFDILLCVKRFSRSR